MWSKTIYCYYNWKQNYCLFTNKLHQNTEVVNEYLHKITLLLFYIVECVLNSTDTTATTKLKFNTTIEIWCDYSETVAIDIYNSTLLMEFKPEYYLLQTQNTIEINHSLLPSTVQAGRWQISVSSRSIRIRGDPVKCGGEGYFNIALIQNPNKRFLSIVNIQIESKWGV